MAFDPDKYLASAPAFDPDAYLKASANGMPGTRAAAPEERQGFFGKVGAGLASLADVTVGGVLPMAGQAVQAVARPFTTPQRAEELGGMVASAVDKPFGKAFGVTETPAYKQEGSRQLMDFIGANLSKGADWIAKQTGLPVEDVRNMVNTSTLLAPAVVKGVTKGTVNALQSPLAQELNAAQAQVGNALAERLAGPLVRREITKGQANLAKSYQNAAQIEAAQAAQKLGAALNPAVSNPTTGNIVKGAVTGTVNKEASLAKRNEGVWVREAKKVIGAEENSVLNDAAFDAALDKASKPYEPVKNLAMQPTDEVVAALEAARIPEQIGGKGSAAAVNTLVDQAQELLQQGRSGDAVLKDIRQLRRNANSIQQSQKAGMAPDPAKMAEADASIKIANALEQLIDANAPNPQVLEGIQKARTKLAQIFDVERATNKVTGRVDPAEFAKMLGEGKQLSGTLRDMGMIAGNFPSIAAVDVNAAPVIPNLSRSGPAGTAGYGFGAATGLPTAATSVAGSGLGGLVGTLAARRMATPEYQAAYAIPRDYRPPVNQLRPAEAVRAPTQPAVYDWSNATAPNFTMPRGPYGAEPEVQFGAEVPNALRALPAPSAEGTLNALRAEDVRRANVSRAVGQQAEAQAAAAEAAARRPARGEVILDINPLTGAPEISKGLKGATPESFQNFGSSLASAANKATAGKTFDMTAAEKVAWDKTKVDLAEVVPGMKSLNDKAIAAKMQDRAWVQDAIAKAQEKARAFEDIAARAANERLRQDALMKREQMMDLLDSLEEQFSKARPVKTGGQGPKTRAHQRNMLRPDGEEIQNALVK